MDDPQLIARANSGNRKGRACLPCPGNWDHAAPSAHGISPIFRRAIRFQLHSMTYKQYLRSEHWQLLRGASLQISPKCTRCKSDRMLEVHHTVYRESWFDTKLSDLLVLCHDCHMLEHAKAWERLPEKPVRLIEAPSIKPHAKQKFFNKDVSKAKRMEARLAAFKSARKRRLKKMRSAN